ncbi:MAG TPA: hypothetical protein VEX62_13635 [Candidatus Limnocylindrales bacterium]|nr:hypothetical protein [Candidatus Limnocylindrales bacterium]
MRLALLAIAMCGSVLGCSVAIPETTPTSGPTAAPDTELESLFPERVGGFEMTVSSASGEAGLSVLGDGDPARLDQFLLDLGATREQLSVATGTLVSADGALESGLAMIAIRVAGLDASMTEDRLAQVVGSDVPNTVIDEQERGGKTVTAISNAQDLTESVYLYPAGDVVFLVSGAPNLVEEALTQLP